MLGGRAERRRASTNSKNSEQNVLANFVDERVSLRDKCALRVLSAPGVDRSCSLARKPSANLLACSRSGPALMAGLALAESPLFPSTKLFVPPLLADVFVRALQPSPIHSLIILDMFRQQMRRHTGPSVAGFARSCWGNFSTTAALSVRGRKKGSLIAPKIFEDFLSHKQQVFSRHINPLSSLSFDVALVPGRYVNRDSPTRLGRASGPEEKHF